MVIQRKELVIEERVKDEDQNRLEALSNVRVSDGNVCKPVSTLYLAMLRYQREKQGDHQPEEQEDYQPLKSV